jgi:hypothetical protein
MTASAARRARRASAGGANPRTGPGDRCPPPGTAPLGDVRVRNLSPAGAAAMDAIRVNGREAFLEKTFALLESDDPGKRFLGEFMLRGAREALS